MERESPSLPDAEVVPVRADAPYGVMVVGGRTFARAAPVRWVCYRRDSKLLFLLAIALFAGITMVLLFALSFPNTGILIMAILIALLLAVEYLFLARECRVDPLTGANSCNRTGL